MAGGVIVVRDGLSFNFIGEESFYLYKKGRAAAALLLIVTIGRGCAHISHPLATIYSILH